MNDGRYLLDTHEAEAIFSSLHQCAEGRILASSACASIGSRNNLYRLLLTESGERLLSYAATDDCRISSEYSDYENFVALLRLLPSLSGSGYYGYVRLTVERLFGESDFSFEEVSREEPARTIWERVTPLILEKDLFDEWCKPFSGRSAFDAGKWVVPDQNRLSPYDTLDGYRSDFEKAVRGAAQITVDLSEITFVSPDPYHAEMSFSQIRLGSESKEMRDYFASQMLREIGGICKKCGIPLLLKGDPSGTNAAGMLSYFKKTSRLPQLRYALPFDNAAEADRRFRTAESLGLTYEITEIVPSGLLSGSVTSVKESLRMLSGRYPLGKLRFIADGETIPERYMMYERFARILSTFLAELLRNGDLADASTAVLLGDRILTGDQASPNKVSQ